jgi:lipopolysaccharide export LptBFGC system permease protein LptF
VIEAELFDPEQGFARELTIYRLGDDGLPSSRIDARAGFHVGGGVWRLVEPSRIDLEGGAARRVEAKRHEKLGKAIEAEVDTMHLSVAEIARLADETEAGGFDAAVLRTDYFAKLAEPLACIVLPAAVLFFAVTGPPFPGPAQTLLVSGVMGVIYVLATGVAASLGHGGQIPPWLGGSAGVAGFGALAAFFAQRMWRRL